MGFGLAQWGSRKTNDHVTIMKKYLVHFKDGSTWDIWASSAHNAEQIAIGTAAHSSGKPCAYWAEQIKSVELT